MWSSSVENKAKKSITHHYYQQTVRLYTLTSGVVDESNVSQFAKLNRIHRTSWIGRLSYFPRTIVPAPYFDPLMCRLVSRFAEKSRFYHYYYIVEAHFTLIKYIGEVVHFEEHFKSKQKISIIVSNNSLEVAGWVFAAKSKSNVNVINFSFAVNNL